MGGSFMVPYLQQRESVAVEFELVSDPFFCSPLNIWALQAEQLYLICPKSCDSTLASSISHRSFRATNNFLLLFFSLHFLHAILFLCLLGGDA